MQMFFLPKHASIEKIINMHQYNVDRSNLTTDSIFSNKLENNDIMIKFLKFEMTVKYLIFYL